MNATDPPLEAWYDRLDALRAAYPGAPRDAILVPGPHWEHPTPRPVGARAFYAQAGTRPLWALVGLDPWRVGLHRWDAAGATLSTVFLGLDHSGGLAGEPEYFETMLTVGDGEREYWRHATYADALRFHEVLAVALIPQFGPASAWVVNDGRERRLLPAPRP